MKYLHPFFFLSLALIAAALPAAAQTDDTGDVAPPPGSTVITSDELHSDQANHQSVFSGNVITVGTNFRLTCEEMTVYFTPDNKVDQIVATGNVIITQPGRVTHCGHAVYNRTEDTFDLTDQPRILNGKDQVIGTRIIINRTTQKMTVTGGRSTVILGSDSLGGPAPASATPGLPTDNK